MPSIGARHRIGPPSSQARVPSGSSTSPRPSWTGAAPSESARSSRGQMGDPSVASTAWVSSRWRSSSREREPWAHLVRCPVGALGAGEFAAGGGVDLDDERGAGACGLAQPVDDVGGVVEHGGVDPDAFAVVPVGRRDGAGCDEDVTPEGTMTSPGAPRWSRRPSAPDAVQLPRRRRLHRHVGRAFGAVVTLPTRAYSSGVGMVAAAVDARDGHPRL
ncbi:MAG: hypothetical protein R2713_09655 [Ilumatobacteraceae bacterium]